MKLGDQIINREERYNKTNIAEHLDKEVSDKFSQKKMSQRSQEGVKKRLGGFW